MLTARAGDDVLITLPSLAGAGYQWHVVGDHPELVVTSTVAAGAAVGGGDVVVSIHVVAPVHRRIPLRLVRRWEGVAASVDAFDFELRAR